MICYVCDYKIENQDNEQLIKCPNCNHNVIDYDLKIKLKLRETLEKRNERLLKKAIEEEIDKKTHINGKPSRLWTEYSTDKRNLPK